MLIFCDFKLFSSICEITTSFFPSRRLTFMANFPSPGTLNAFSLKDPAAIMTLPGSAVPETRISFDSAIDSVSGACTSNVTVRSDFFCLSETGEFFCLFIIAEIMVGIGRRYDESELIMPGPIRMVLVIQIPTQNPINVARSASLFIVAKDKRI